MLEGASTNFNDAELYYWWYSSLHCVVANLCLPQGVAILLPGVFGTANGSSVFVENAGLLGLTQVGSQRVVQISAGFMIFFSVLGKFGVVFASIPQSIIRDTLSFSSEAFVAGIVAYFLDNTLHKKDNSIRKDRGKHWWDKLRTFKGDSRSDEFYSLPFRLNKYFPAV